MPLHERHVLSDRMPAGRNNLLLVVLLVAAAVPRIVAIHDPRMVLEQDEAVMGLGAMHVGQGLRWPMFCYGSDYGFCLPETLLGATTIAVGGHTAEAVKYAMLPLFLSGLCFFYLTLQRLTDSRTAFATALLLAVCPPWHQWAMQMRGGYLVAFAASCFVWWWAACVRQSAMAWNPFVPGLLGAVVFHAQPFWLPATLAFAVILLLPRAGYRGVLHMLVVFLAAVGAGRLLLLWYTAHFLPEVRTTWHPEVLLFQPPWSAIRHASSLVFHHLTTDGFGGRSGWWRLAGAAELLLIAAATGVAGWQVRRGRMSAAVVASGVAMAACLLYPTIIMPRDRYLLPLSQAMWMFVAVVWHGWADRSRFRRAWGAGAAASLVALFACGAADAWWQRPVASDCYAKGDLARLLHALDSRLIGHCYVLNPLHTWPIIFHSGEAVVARWINEVDRCPWYQAEVDRAWREGRPTAVVGEVKLLDGRTLHEWAGSASTPVDPRDVVIVEDTPFFILRDPPPQVLRDLQFRIRPDTER